MIRFLIMYKQPLDKAAFEKHYREVHIPLARELEGVRRYTVSRNVAAVRGDKPYYMIAELDWDDMDSLKQAFQSPAGKATAKDVSENLEKLCPGIQSMIYELEEV